MQTYFQVAMKAYDSIGEKTAVLTLHAVMLVVIQSAAGGDPINAQGDQIHPKGNHQSQKTSVGGHRIKSGARITNGGDAQPGDFPFLASMLIEGRPTCGATFFTSSRVFLTCRCLIRYPHSSYKYPNHALLDPEKIEVVAGSIFNDVEYYQEGDSRYAKTLKVHPKCEHNKSAMLYDYGAIEVQSPFTLIKGVLEVYTISIEDKSRITQAIMNPESLLCQAMGWGSVMQEFPDPIGLLSKINVTLMPLEWCEKKIYERTKDLVPGGVKFVRDVQVCVTGQGENQTVCRGDGGSPLVCGIGTENKIVIGVLTGRPAGPCGEDKSPGMYARLDIALDWIINAFSSETTPDITTTDSETISQTTTISTPSMETFVPITQRPSSAAHPLESIFPLNFLLIQCIIQYLSYTGRCYLLTNHRSRQPSSESASAKM